MEQSNPVISTHLDIYSPNSTSTNPTTQSPTTPIACENADSFTTDSPSTYTKSTKKTSRKRSRSETETTDEEPNNEKKARRRLQNRVAAQNSRLRKKYHIETLEDKNNNLLEENKRLNNTVQDLSSENEKLKLQLIELHKQLAVKEEQTTPSSNLSNMSSPVSLGYYTPIESAALNRHSLQMERGIVKTKSFLTQRSTTITTSFIHLMRLFRQLLIIMSTSLATLWFLWGWKIYTTQQIFQFSALLQQIYCEKVDRENNVNNFLLTIIIPRRTVNFLHFRQKKRKRRKKKENKFSSSTIHYFNVLSSYNNKLQRTQSSLAIQQEEKILISSAFNNVAFYVFINIIITLQSLFKTTIYPTGCKPVIDNYSLFWRNHNDHNLVLCGM